MYRTTREAIELSLLILASAATRTRWRSLLEEDYEFLQVFASPGELPEDVTSLIAVLVEGRQGLGALGELIARDVPLSEVPLLIVGSSPEIVPAEMLSQGHLMIEFLPAGEHLRVLLPLRVHQAYQWYRLRRRALMAEEFLREVQKQLSVITHDLNNPVAIISGNAQLLLELSSMMELDEEFAQSLKDIEEASLRIAQYLRPTGMLKNRIVQFLNRQR